MSQKKSLNDFFIFSWRLLSSLRIVQTNPHCQIRHQGLQNCISCPFIKCKYIWTRRPVVEFLIKIIRQPLDLHSCKKNFHIVFKDLIDNIGLITNFNCLKQNFYEFLILFYSRRISSSLKTLHE
ncbi:hypothetical protein BpHYR1_006169 [Brachionus plicatilis]|uniref:Uncharacterized protein n=1 Tax=Brachionus plicatilis TaxID=10195 RepID=A0A3M7RE16_BRAPC|nr:hypothetical protein BpHYR1_006169 [Brachionus plicatilis]